MCNIALFGANCTSFNVFTHLNIQNLLFDFQLQDTVKSLSDVGKANFTGILYEQLQNARVPDKRKRIKTKIMLSIHRRLAHHRERYVEELRETSVSFQLRDIHQVHASSEVRILLYSTTILH